MASFQERLLIVVEANAGKAIAEFKKVEAAAKEAEAGAEGGAKGLARFGIAGKTASNLLKGGIALGVAGASTAIAKFAVDGVSAFVEVAGEIRKFQRVSGASAEDASKLVAAFHILGVEGDTAAASVFQLARRIESTSEKLADVGVVVARSANGSANLVETILNIGDAYRATEDPAKRANLVFTAFGRGGAPIIPILGKTRSELEAIFAAADRHGLIFDQEQLDRAKEYGLATRELGESFKGLQIAAGEKLIPFLTDLSIAITKVVDAANQDDGGFWSGLIDHAKTTVFGGIIESVGDAIHWLAGNEGEAARAVAETTNALTEQATKLDDLKKAIFTATDAQRSYEAAGRSVDDANRGLVKATADYNKLLKDGAVDEEKVADARRSLADATRSVGHAQREQTKAQDEYNDALAAFNILGTDTAADELADKKDNLADANDSVASAQESATKAAEDLKAAQAGDPDFNDKLADAKQHVADATQDVADATYNLGKRSYENVAAHNAETDAIADKADQVERLKGDLEAMAKLNPEQYAFLAPIIAALGGIGPGSPTPAPAPSGGLLGLPLVAPTPRGVPEDAWRPATTTTNNVTINATTSEADARLIAKEVMWNLN